MSFVTKDIVEKLESGLVRGLDQPTFELFVTTLMGNVAREAPMPQESFLL